ncbi:MAG TPA: DUF6325 family protein [Ktedonobacterales bacterium]|jgi:hypothetical protein|nr:DUF6325 family protein [Ktedonobacterales bacterium]
MPLGPVELLAVKFPRKRVQGDVASALRELVESGTIRIIDLLIARKDAAGNVTMSEINDLDDEDYAAINPIVSDLTGMLSREDVNQLSSLMENDSSAAVMLFENTWATRFRDAVVHANGQVLYNERIPRAVVDEVVALSEQPLA